MISRDLLISEDIGVDTRIVIICQLELDVLVKLQLRLSILDISGRYCIIYKIMRETKLSIITIPVFITITF